MLQKIDPGISSIFLEIVHHILFILKKNKVELLNFQNVFGLAPLWAARKRVLYPIPFSMFVFKLVQFLPLTRPSLAHRPVRAGRRNTIKSAGALTGSTPYQGKSS